MAQDTQENISNMRVQVNEDINSVKLQIGLLEKDVQSLGKFCDKVSESIQKIQELNVNFIKMISICEQKHNLHDQVEDGVKNDIKDLHEKIDDFNTEIRDKMVDVERCISQKIDDLRKDILIDNKTEKTTDYASKFKEMDKWQWAFVGGAAVIGWGIGHLELLAAFIKVFK